MSVVCFPLDIKVDVTSAYNEYRDLTYLGGNYDTASGYHEGMDLAPHDTVDLTRPVYVYATEAGTIQRASDTGKDGYGRCVILNTNDGKSILYGHLTMYYVKTGQEVVPGQKLGTMGSTGNSTGKHLHFGVYYGKYIDYKQNLADPAFYLNLNKSECRVGNVIDFKQYKQKDYITLTDDGQTNYEVGGMSTGVTYEYQDIKIPTGKIYKIVGESQYIGSHLFNRKYSIVISDRDGNAIEVSDLHCEFICRKTARDEPTYCTLTIYNLSADTESMIMLGAYYIKIMAGYDGSPQYGKIFEGFVIQPTRGKENGVDYYLRLLAVDAQRFQAFGMVNASLSSYQTMRSVVDYCSTNTLESDTKLSGDDISIINTQYPRGKVLFGNSKRYLEIIAKTQSKSLFFDNNEAGMFSLEIDTNEEIIDLGPDSGLIETPRQTNMSIGGTGINAKSLLNPLITLGSLIHVENVRVVSMEHEISQLSSDSYSHIQLDTNGIYRVISIIHQGDTRGRNWYTEFNAVSQGGALMGIASAGFYNIW